ncbi:unnamed protein product [Caenorhabditis nigoni]
MNLTLNWYIFVLLLCLPVSVNSIECLNYRVAEGQPILKAERNPRCHSKAEYCVKITGNSKTGNEPFISGRCEHSGECKEHRNDCFIRTDAQGMEENVCCSDGNFSNKGTHISVTSSIILLTSVYVFLF